MKASKKNHIRLIRGIAAVMSAGLVLSMAGCGGGETTGSGTGASEATYKTVDLQQRKIKIYQYGFRKNTITSTESGKRFMNRVAEIEKAFNCVIDLPEDDNYTAVWNATLAGKPSHDIMSIAAPHLFAQPATNGVFMDLSQFKDAFDFSADKWDQDLLQSYQLHGKQYGCSTGTDITGNTVMYFNKRLVKEAGYNPDDLYKWQEDGSWKWSKFKEMATKISKLSSGSTTIWGSVNNAYQFYNNLCVSNGSNWITKDQSGVHFNADDEKCMQAMDFMMELQKAKVIPDTTDFNDYKLFLEGKVGFIPEYIERLQHKEGYGGMQDDFGMVMFPKSDSESSYRSINDWYQGWAILEGVAEPEKVALVLNALTEPLYPDEAELNKLNSSLWMSWVRDEGSLKVFDLVKNNTYVSPVLFASPVDAQWQSKVGEILKGKKTNAEALQEVKSQYTETLNDLWAPIDAE